MIGYAWLSNKLHFTMKKAEETTGVEYILVMRYNTETFL